MYDTNEIENINTNKNKTRLKNNRSLKVVATVICLLVLACLGGLTYNTIKLNNQKSKLESDIESTKEELVKANEVVSKYELATGTKAVETGVENTKIKEIVKPMAIDTKIGELVNMIDREHRGKMHGENDEGLPIVDNWPVITFNEIFTNNDATYLFAKMYITGNYEVITNKEKGSKRIEGGRRRRYCGILSCFT